MGMSQCVVVEVRSKPRRVKRNHVTCYVIDVVLQEGIPKWTQELRFWSYDDAARVKAGDIFQGR